MNKLASQCQLSPNEGENMRAILEYTELMFAKNDHYHQEGYFTKQIAEVSFILVRTILPSTDYMKLSIVLVNWMKDKQNAEFTQKKNSLIS